MKKLTKRVVIKIGSSSITHHEYGLNTAFMESIAKQVSTLKRDGIEVALVSSGAVAAGRRILGDINGDLVDKQIAAMYGQPELISEWRRAFLKYGILVGQGLFTGNDLDQPKLPLLGALKMGVPVINANDPVNNEEMKRYLVAADNDQLSGFVTELIDAQKLVLLTDIDGVLDNSGHVIREINSFDDLIKIETNGKSASGTGGMMSKLDVAWVAAYNGRTAWIANAHMEDVILKIVQGESVGTKVCLK